MNVMITGAQFSNKGAQSLLFNLMNQLREYYNDITIYYMPLDDYTRYPHDVYKFEVVYGRQPALDYAKGMTSRFVTTIKAAVKALLQKKHIPLQDIKKYYRILPQIDVLIDISGYQLSSKWDIKINRRYLEYIENAKKYGSKVILMPQSFGPFEYGSFQADMEQQITRVLKKVDLIFAREHEGATLLQKLGIENVEVSPDLVLQADAVKWENIFYDKPEIHCPFLETKNNIGIIPNFQTFEHGNSENVLKIYQSIVRHLISKGKNVYIFRHSADINVCKKIYEGFADEKNVYLIEDELDCLDYAEFIKQFDFIVASRYHAVVHAYKENIPVIILGWAVKYQELAELMNQERYVFDITGTDFGVSEKIISAIDMMDDHVLEEKSRITAGLDIIRKNSCFEKCREVIG